MDHSVTNGWRVAWRQARLPHEDFNDKVTYFTWQALAKAVEPARPYLEEIPRLIGTKRYGSAVYDQGMEAAVETLRFMNLRAADKWLLRASLLAMREGDRATARQHAEALLDLIRITENERLMIIQLIRDAMGNRAVALIWELLADKAWDDESLKRLQERCEAMRFVEPMIAAVEMERAMNVNEFHRYRTSDDAWDDAVASMNELESIMGSSSLGGFYRSRFHRFAWRLMWSDLDEHRALVQWNVFVDVFRESVGSWGSKETRDRLKALSSGETAWFGVIEESEELDFMDAARFLFSNSMSTSEYTLVRRSLQAEAMKNLACCGLALERWRIRHGEYPDSLGKLDSLLDTKVMVDPLGAGAMKYRRNDDGSYILYSCGLDGTDDGGDPTPEEEGADPFWNGRDMVWPGHSRTKQR